MKKSILVVAVLAVVIGFGASGAFAAKQCSVADYDAGDGFCKCQITDANGRTTYPHVDGKKTKKDCEGYCQSFCKKSVKPIPIVIPEL